MGAVAAKVVLALGIDGLAQWVIRFVVTFLVVSIVVVLIVVQTVASVLTGGQTGQRTGTPGSAVALTPVTVPSPIAGQPFSVDLGSRIIQLAQVWLGVPYLFGGCSRAGVDCLPRPKRVRGSGYSLAARGRRPVQRHGANRRSTTWRHGVLCQHLHAGYFSCRHLCRQRHADKCTDDRTGRERGARIHWVLGRPLRRCSQCACLNSVCGLHRETGIRGADDDDLASISNLATTAKVLLELFVKQCYRHDQSSRE
jgi:hypothetical protein